jgi:hypothetical protein
MVYFYFQEQHVCLSCDIKAYSTWYRKWRVSFIRLHASTVMAIRVYLGYSNRGRYDSTSSASN